nr:uncharacterized protein LOC109151131 [Ipomoea batatas]
MYCAQPFDDPNQSTEKKFGAWLRAPNRRPSPVTGNRWVVASEKSDRITTDLPLCQGAEAVAGTHTTPGMPCKDAQSTPCPLEQHVSPVSGMYPTTTASVSNDIIMEQAINQEIDDGLIILDPKRKRSKLTTLPIEPTTSFIDLNGPFPNAKAASLTTAKSDHMPLLLQLLPQSTPIPSANFRFESLWLREAHCRNIMVECWSRTMGQSLMDRVGSCSKAIWIWGKHYARNFQKRLDYWRRRMEATKHRHDYYGVKLFRDAQAEYLRVLHHQNDYWRQRAKHFWLKNGDTNSNFFHRSVKRRQQVNRLTKLKDNNGVWIQRGLAELSRGDLARSCRLRLVVCLLIRVYSPVSGYRLVRPGSSRQAGRGGSFLISRAGVLHHAPHSPGDYSAHQHRPPAVVSAVGAVVGSAAAGGGADPGHLVALEAVAYDGADAAAGERAAQAGRATRPQRARERGAVKPQQLVPVGGAPRVLLAGGVGAYLHGVSAVLEPLDRALRVVDLQYPFDLANRVVLL